MTPHGSASADHFKHYDDVPYQSHPFPATHPAHLAGVAELTNIHAPNVHTARVLELGCAAGGNIIPLSFYYPNMTLVGVDYSKVQIDEGQRIIRELGVTNVKLHHMSIADITPSFGKFDYIIAHGLYSWVAPEIQDETMRVIQENLSENGVAFVSYNVYPGWKIHEITRDAMQFHARNFDFVKEQVPHGRGMMQFLKELAPKGSMYHSLLEQETQQTDTAADYYLAHEYFEEHNLPCYFLDFINHAFAYNLIYLGESDFPSMFAQQYSPEVQERLLSVSNAQQLELEQYFDFIKNRSFRQTLLSHAPQAEHIERDISGKQLKRISYNCAIEIEAKTNGLNTRYTLPQQSEQVMQQPVEQAVLKTLHDNRLRYLSYAQLFELAANNLKAQQGASAVLDEKLLQSCLVQLILTGYISPMTQTPEVNLNQTVPTHPRINRLAAHYAALTGQLVSSLHHSRNCEQDIIITALLPYLDGQHSEAQLTQRIADAVLANKITFISTDNQKPITDIQLITQEAQQYVRSCLRQLCREGHLLETSA